MSVVPETKMTAVPEALPEFFGPYRILSVLGEGGMARVYQGEHETLNRVIAIKVLRTDIGNVPGFKELFLREAQLAARVEHSNVVPIYDAGECDNHLYMVLRFIPGGDTFKSVARNGAFPPVEAARIALDCAQGLTAIHKAGLVHRDVKPSNVFLETDGHALLGDLGLARRANGHEGLTKLFMPGFALGTPAYMSPEQAKSQADIDIRSDIFSLGATFYFLLTGKDAFQGASDFEIAGKCLYEPTPDPRLLNPSIPPRFTQVILKMMEKTRERRYQSPAELCEDLRNLLGESGGSGRAPGTSRTQMKRICAMCLNAVDGTEMVPYEGQHICAVCVQTIFKKAQRRATQESSGTLDAVAQHEFSGLKAPKTPVRQPAPTPVKPTGSTTVMYRGRAVEQPVPPSGPKRPPSTAKPTYNPPPPQAEFPVLPPLNQPPAPAPKVSILGDLVKPPSSRVYGLQPGFQAPVTPTPSQMPAASPPAVVPTIPQPPAGSPNTTRYFRGRAIPNASPAPGTHRVKLPPPEGAIPVPPSGPVRISSPIPIFPEPPIIETPPSLPVLPPLGLQKREITPPVLKGLNAPVRDGGTRLLPEDAAEQQPEKLPSVPVTSALKNFFSRMLKDWGSSVHLSQVDGSGLALSGDLTDRKLFQVLQFINGLKKSGELQLVSDSLRGVIAFHAGTITFARTQTQLGLPALHKCVKAQSGTFRFIELQYQPEHETNIPDNTMMVLLECCRVLDENTPPGDAPKG